jgi:hypothetical protein
LPCGYLLKKKPVKKCTLVEPVAALAVFLATDAAAVTITGADYTIDGDFVAG